MLGLRGPVRSRSSSIKNPIPGPSSMQEVPGCRKVEVTVAEDEVRLEGDGRDLSCVVQPIHPHPPSKPAIDGLYMFCNASKEALVGWSDRCSPHIFALHS